LEAVNLHTADLQMVHLKVVDWEGSATGAETLFIGELIIVGMYQIEYNKVHQEMRDWMAEGDSQSWNVCRTQYMLYLVFTHDHGMQIWKEMT